MFTEDRRVIVVVGAQWGDEGKGKLVDVLAERADWVARYQGGANAGHTVEIGNAHYVLHQIPSGILRRGVKCAIGNGAVVGVEELFEEIDGLVKHGVEVEGRFFISDRAHLLLPYHRSVDVALDRKRGIGTTGRGIGPAYTDKVGRIGIRAGVVHEDQADLREQITQQITRQAEELRRLGVPVPREIDSYVQLDEMLRRLRPFVHDVGFMLHQEQKRGAAILAEGAQGSLLDVDHGSYPFVTSSNTTAGGASIGTGLGPTTIDVVLGVAKAYTTRVGGGPLPTRLPERDEKTLRRLGKEFGATTGRARSCGWYDAVVVSYAARINGFTHLAITKLDILSPYSQIPICVGYNGIDPNQPFPSSAKKLEKVKPIYELMPGWQRSLSRVRKFADLPKEAQAYVHRLGELAQTPIAYISVGAKRPQIIAVD